MRVDLILEASHSGARLAELAQLAEKHGFGGIWVSNMHDARDPFINFVQSALTTKRITIGPVAVSPYELHPMKMAASLLTLKRSPVAAPISASRPEVVGRRRRWASSPSDACAPCASASRS
jgi:hypothetical protein